MESKGLPIFLVGARAAGKTTVGRRLAQKLEAEFVDTDLFLNEELEMTVAELVAKEGWDAFRLRESEALQKVTTPNRVIATGGGMVLADHNRNFMRANGTVLYLSAPAEFLAARLAEDPQAAQRPSLTGKSVLEEVAHILSEREELYQAAAHHIISAVESVDEVIAAILSKINNKI